MLRIVLLLAALSVSGCNASDTDSGQSGAGGAAGYGGSFAKPGCKETLPKQYQDCVTNEECGEWMGCYYERGCEKTSGKCHRLDGCPDAGGPHALYHFCDCNGNVLDGGWNQIGVGGPWGGDCGLP